MTVFHGSEFKIEKPYVGGGKTTNDYGSGFYCTESEDLACEWAVTQRHDGYANRYALDMRGLKVLDLNGDGYCVLHWLAVLLRHRAFDVRYGVATLARPYLMENFAVDISKYDVIRGYRADDSYFSFAQDFLNGTISLEKLNEAMHLGKYGMQYVLKSRRAFSRLKFVDAAPALRDPWFIRKTARDETANGTYLGARKKRIAGLLYIPEILDKAIGPKDERLLRALS